MDGLNSHKRKPLTLEHRQNLSRAKMGHLVGVATRQKLSASHKLLAWEWDVEELRRLYIDEEMSTREIACLKGCHGSTVHKALLRYNIPTRKGSFAFLSAKSRAKLKASLKRVQASKEYKTRRSENSKRHWANPESSRANRDAILKAIKQPEYKEKQRRISMQRWENPEYRIRGCQASKKMWSNPSYRSKISDARKRTWADPEYRAKVSKIRKQYWADLENQDEVRKMMMVAMRVKPNKAERHLYRILDELYPTLWKYTGDGKLIVAGKNPDFWDGGHRLIELYGTYWHRGQESQHRMDEFAKYGYDCLVIWEHELKDEMSVMAKIREFNLVEVSCY